MGIRAKMAREDRAKQFMPFAALKGYPEALRRKEELFLDKSKAVCENEVNEFFTKKGRGYHEDRN